jgi:hypothetical protein
MLEHKWIDASLVQCLLFALVNQTDGIWLKFRTQNSQKAPNPTQATKNSERTEGRLWQLGKLTKMTDTEMDAWAREGDSCASFYLHLDSHIIGNSVR